jgi:NodT family efflux transporter outer membrane factor (OMF) lipoprotein
VSLPTSFESKPAVTANQGVSLDRWWDDFHDPQLTGLISTALERSTTARLAYARIMEARALRSLDRASTLPSGSLSGTATLQGSEALWGAGVSQGGQDSYRANFTPNWEVDVFGRLAAIRDRADLDYAASALDFHAARLALAADVAVSLFQSRFIAAQLVDAQDALRIAKELADAAALGQSHGITAGQDVARLTADVASAEAEVARLSGNLQSARRSLLILIGDPAAPTDSLPIEAKLDAPPAVPGIAPGALLTRRPDVLSAEIALQSAAQTVQIDRLALFPQFNIQPGIGLAATGDPVAAGTGLWSLIAGFTLPVLDRARLLAALRVSEARGQQAVIGYERAVQAAFGEAENSLTGVTTDQRRTQQLERATRDAKFAFDAARKGYAAGLTDLTTLIQIERVWLQNRSSLNGARASLLIDTVNAIRALGGGWDPEVSLAADQPQLPASGNN